MKQTNVRFFSSHLIPLSRSAKVFKKLFWGAGKFLSLLTFGSYRFPRKNFEENPLYYSWKDPIYLGYKYFHKHIMNADKNSGLEKYFKENKIEFLNKNDDFDSKITLAIGGDLMPYELINEKNANQFWDKSGDFLLNADVSFANLETPINKDKPATQVKELMLNDLYFNAHEDVFDLFNGNGKFKGFDIVSTANNHSLDQGHEGLENTIKFLEEKQVKYVGTQLQKRDGFEPVFVERNNIKIAFVAATYSLNRVVPDKEKAYQVNHLRLNLPEVDLTPIISGAKKAWEKGADILVLSLHCGNAYQAYPSMNTVKLFHTLFEKTGADIIAGHHAHNPQPMESYRYQNPVTKKEKIGYGFYSLGDLCAYDINYYCHLPQLFQFEIGKSREGAFISKINGFQGLISLLDYPKNTKIQMLNLLELAENNFENPSLTKTGKHKARKLYAYWQQFLNHQGIDWVK